MKRMNLVPEDIYARFEQKQNLETSPIMKNMINTDTDMTDILQRTDVDDTEKQKLYYANLERNLNLRQQKDCQTPTVQIAPSTTNKEELSPPNNAQLSDAVVVEHIPKTMHPSYSYSYFKPFERNTGRYHMGQNRRSEARR